MGFNSGFKGLNDVSRKTAMTPLVLAAVSRFSASN